MMTHNTRETRLQSLLEAGENSKSKSTKGYSNTIIPFAPQKQSINDPQLPATRKRIIRRGKEKPNTQKNPQKPSKLLPTLYGRWTWTSQGSVA